MRDAGAAGEITGASREWQFGDEQPLDVVRTVRNAVLRTRPTFGTTPDPRSAAEDFEVVETERRIARAAVALLVDMSYSMELRGTWGEAKTTALALHSLVTHEVPAGRDRDHRVQRLRPGACHRARWSTTTGTGCRAPTCSTR